MLFTGNFDPSKLIPDMKFSKSLLVFSFIGIAGAAVLFGGVSSFFNNGDPNPQKDAEIMRTVLEGLQRMHFQPKELDDKFSKDLYQLYLDDLDNGKRFFTQEDIALFQPFESQLDDQARGGTFTFFDLSLQRYDLALTKTQNWYREILGKKMDFNANETVNMDGKKIKWPKDDAELRRRWELMLKYEVLSRIVDEEEKQNKADFKGEKNPSIPSKKKHAKKCLISTTNGTSASKKWTATAASKFISTHSPISLTPTPVITRLKRKKTSTFKCRANSKASAPASKATAKKQPSPKSFREAQPGNRANWKPKTSLPK
jgi:hypothetical protein